ncbi:MAG: cytochrome ubiquinol oxidase subunit I, partial [Anaerolineae bacterium]
KFVHTVGAGYVTASIFVLAVSAWYLLKGRDLPFARRSFAVAAGFGLASILSVIVLGDESGYITGQVQKIKLAAMEAEWETEAPPASFTVVGIPRQEKQETGAAVKVPWVGGLIVTRTIDTPIIGVKDLIAESEARIRSGIRAYEALMAIRAGEKTPATLQQFEANRDHLGYGLLVQQYAPNVVDATEAQIQQAARSTIPNVFMMFWTFRIMVGLGFWMLAVIAVCFYYCATRTFDKTTWLLKLVIAKLPAPWIACFMGWFVSEYGRQPWTIGEVLPTFLSTSSLSVGSVIGSMIALVVLYTIFLIVEIFLMARFVKIGPSSLHTGRYHFEQPAAARLGEEAAQ